MLVHARSGSIPTSRDHYNPPARQQPYAYMHLLSMSVGAFYRATHVLLHDACAKACSCTSSSILICTQSITVPCSRKNMFLYLFFCIGRYSSTTTAPHFFSSWNMRQWPERGWLTRSVFLWNHCNVRIAEGIHRLVQSVEHILVKSSNPPEHPVVIPGRAFRSTQQTFHAATNNPGGKPRERAIATV